MLLRVFGRGEARTFEVIDDRHRLALEQLAGGPGDLQVFTFELRVFGQKGLGITLHERVVEGPPGQAQEGHPDQFFFQEELEERRAPVKALHQGGDINPRLVIADHQIRGLAAQAFGAANVPLGGQAQGKNAFVDFGPGFGNPHHRPRIVIAQAPRRCQFEQGKQHQRPEQDQGVAQQ